MFQICFCATTKKWYGVSYFSPKSLNFDIFLCMSKYEPLWKYIKTKGTSLIKTATSATQKSGGAAAFKLSYDEIEKVLGFPIDHSFLTYKKELLDFGYKVGKISMKEKFVMFEKV